MVPVQGIGIETSKPSLLNGPEARITRHDLNITIRPGQERIGLRAPGGAAGDLTKSQVLIELDRARIVITDMEPDCRGFFVVGLFHHTFSQSTPTAVAAAIRMHS